MELELVVNGEHQVVDAAPTATLLAVLRNELGLTGTKEGCNEGECGACTVLIDGAAVDSCLIVAQSVSGSEVTTVEGLGSNGSLAPLQQQFVEAGGVQCGFCTPGFLMTLTAFLHEHPSPTDTEIRDAIAGNICRCTGYSQIVEAVQAVAGADR